MTNSNDSEHSTGQRIEPDRFDIPAAPGSLDSPAQQSEFTPLSTLAVKDGAPWWHSQFNLMLCVFGLLVAAAGLFVVLSPAPDAQQFSTIVDADGSTRTASSAADSLGSDDTAPWDEQRRAQARVDSQDVLAELLRSKKALERKNVLEWAPDRYQQALDQAAAGDEFYKQKDFAQAIQTYRAALAEMESLNELIPEILAEKIAAGDAAIIAGKSSLAREKFEEALKLDQSSIAALRGLDRVANLDQVLDLMRSAAQDEQDFQETDDAELLTLASGKYQQAVDLDKYMQAAKDGLVRVAEKQQDKQFRDAMSQGFNALFAGRYGSARSGFSSALKVQPENATAKAAYRQSLASDKRSSLSSLLASAKRLEANEEWASALSNYQVVLQRDPNQVSAKLGQIRSEARSKLDQRLKAVLADDLALSRATQRERAEKALQDARAIQRKGPVLSGQIAKLEASLQNVDSTIKVAFVSDSLTEISLTKAGANKLRLGKFDSKNLALKPGRYVLTGVRLGYRDVRREIELRATDSEIQTFSIVCDEPVAGNSSLTSN